MTSEPKALVKTLIRSSLTGFYLTESMEWSEENSAARCFGSTLAAMEFCFQHQLFDSVLEMNYKDLSENIRLRPFKHWRRPGHHGSNTGAT